MSLPKCFLKVENTAVDCWLCIHLSPFFLFAQPWNFYNLHSMYADAVLLFHYFSIKKRKKERYTKLCYTPVWLTFFRGFCCFLLVLIALRRSLLYVLENGLRSRERLSVLVRQRTSSGKCENTKAGKAAEKRMSGEQFFIVGELFPFRIY